MRLGGAEGLAHYQREHIVPRAEPHSAIFLGLYAPLAPPVPPPLRGHAVSIAMSGLVVKIPK